MTPLQHFFSVLLALAMKMFIGDGAKLVRDAFELAKEKCKDQHKVRFCSVSRVFTAPIKQHHVPDPRVNIVPPSSVVAVQCCICWAIVCLLALFTFLANRGCRASVLPVCCVSVFFYFSALFYHGLLATTMNLLFPSGRGYHLHRRVGRDRHEEVWRGAVGGQGGAADHA